MDKIHSSDQTKVYTVKRVSDENVYALKKTKRPVQNEILTMSKLGKHPNIV